MIDCYLGGRAGSIQAAINLEFDRPDITHINVKVLPHPKGESILRSDGCPPTPVRQYFPHSGMYLLLSPTHLPRLVFIT
jgi:hypothetical protein